MRNSSVKWGHMGNFDPTSTNTIFFTNLMGSSGPHVPCAIQIGNKLHHSNSVTFDDKKAKETLMARLSRNTITISETKTLIRLEKVAW